MNKQDKVLIIGGGFAGARVAQDLAKAGFTDVTLTDRKDYFEVTYSTLRTLVDPAFGERARMKYADLMNSKFVQGDVVELQKDSAVMADGQAVPFDHAVVATGSSYTSFPIAKSATETTVEGRKSEMAAAHDTLEKASSVLVIGGGPVGVELAGEIADRYPEKSVTLAQGADRLLNTLNHKSSRRAAEHLSALGVKVLLNTRLSQSDAMFQEADVVYTCVGQTPNTTLMEAHFAQVLDSDGLIKVRPDLRVEGTDNLYALGDCSNTPGLKVGYAADLQGALLAKNIIAEAGGGASKPYKAAPAMAMVPIGRSKGFVQLPFAVTSFRPMVNMKQKDMFIARQYANLGVKR